MKQGDNIRLRSDGRYEARYIKGRNDRGKIIYGSCYGKTEEEAIEKRNFQLNQIKTPKEMNLLILGAGSHGRDVYEIAKELKIFNKISFLDDDSLKTQGTGSGITLGKWRDAENYLHEYPVVTVAVGDEDTRRYWMEKLSVMGFILPVLVHPTAFIPDGTEIGRGTVIGARVTISSGVIIGKGCIITSGSIVHRKTSISDFGYFDFDKIIHYREQYEMTDVLNSN